VTLSHGGHGSGSDSHSAQQTPAGSSAHPGGSGQASGKSSSTAGNVTVAGGPAVTQALAHGSMTVVIDQPAPGLLTEQNRSIEQGAAVAVGQLNAAGGLLGHIHVKLVTQSLDGLSASALQSRLRSDTAAVLVLPCDTDSQLSLAAAGAQFGMLMLSPCNPDAAAGGRYATYWPVGMAATDEAAGLTGYMSRIGYGRVFIVSSPGAQYIELLTNDFRNAAKAHGIQVVGSASIPLATSDYSGLAHEIDAASPRPSAIFTALPPPLVNRLAAGLQAQGVDQTILGSTAMDTPLTLSGPKQLLENATFSSYGFSRENAAAHRFEAEYARSFRHLPVGAFPGLGFETMRVLEAAVGKAHSAEPSAIQHALAGGLTVQGIALADRAYEAGGDHNPAGEVAVSKVSQGSFLPLLASPPTAVEQP